MRVPTVDSIVAPRSVAPAVNVQAPQVRSDAPRVADEMGRGMMGLGRAMVDEAARLQRDVNEARVKERDNALSDQFRKIMTDPDGYLSSLGKDAVDGHKDVVERLNALTLETGDGLENDAQKRMWADVSQRRLQSALSQAGGHAAQQTKVYSAGQSQARAQSAAHDMVANVGDEKLYGMARATMLAEVRKVGELQGKSTEEIGEIERRALSASHTDVVNSLIAADNSKAAGTYLKAYGAEMDPEQRAVFRRQLDAVATKDKSLRLYIGLQKKPYGEQLSSAQAMFEEGKIDADEFDALQTRIDHAESRRNARRDENNRAMLGRAQDWVLSNPDVSVQDMPDELYAWARNNGQLASLNSLARQDTKTDPERFQDINDMLATPEGVQKFIASDLRQERANLSVSDFERFSDIQRNLREGNQKALEIPNAAQRLMALIKNELPKMGVDPTPNKRAESETYAKVVRAAEFELRNLIGDKGVPPTDEQLLKVGRGLAAKGYLQGAAGGWFGRPTKKMRYEFDVDARDDHPFVTVPIAQIPQDTAAKLDVRLQAQFDAGKFRATRGSEEWNRKIEQMYQQLLDQRP